MSFQVFTYYFHNPKLGVGRFILAFGRKCAAVQRKILRKVGNQLASARAHHILVWERGQVLNISRIPELDFLVSAALPRDGTDGLVTAAVSPPRCLHKLNIQSFGAEAAAGSSSDVHSHTWYHTFASL